MITDDKPVTKAGGKTLAHPAHRCSARDLWPTELDELSAAHQNDLNTYLGQFCRPIRNIADEVSCVACGSLLTARTQMTADIIGTTVECDESGHGRCRKCGYPLVIRHEIKSRQGQLLVRLQGFPLLVHPSFIGMTTNAVNPS